MTSQHKSLARRFFDFWQYNTGISHLPDACCPHRRRFLKPYQARLKIVRDYWLYFLAAILILEIAAPFAAAGFLASSFWSIGFLEETPYPDGMQ